MTRATKFKSSFDPSFLVGNLKKWKQLTDIEFAQNTYQMLALLDHERARRDRTSDDSYEKAIKSRASCRVQPYTARHNLRGFTNWQFHHFCTFWTREISHVIKLRRARRAERPMVKTTTWNPTPETAPKAENTARNETTPVSAAMVTPSRAIKAEESSTKPYEGQEEEEKEEKEKEKEDDDDDDDDEFSFPPQQNPEKIADTYSCLNAINSKAPPELIKAFNAAFSKQDPSHTQSSKRRRASNKFDDRATKRQRKR